MARERQAWGSANGKQNPVSPLEVRRPKAEHRKKTEGRNPKYKDVFSELPFVGDLLSGI
jgi:hypothetical protein